MGYSTSFKGEFTLNKKATTEVEQKIKEIREFNPDKINKQNKIKYPLSICCWNLSEDKNKIIWDGKLKFYFYIDWLKYINNEILKPEGLTMHGEILADGEDSFNDVSEIYVADNRIIVKKLSKKEIEKYMYDKQTLKGKRVIEGTTKGHINVLSKYIPIGLSKFISQGLTKKKKDYNPMALTAVKHGKTILDVNLYEIFDKTEKEGKIKFPIKESSEIYVKDIDKIIRYNSGVFKFMSHAKHPFLIKKKTQYAHKELVDVEDPKIIENFARMANVEIEDRNGSFIFIKEILFNKILAPIISLVLYVEIVGIIFILGIGLMGKIGLLIAIIPTAILTIYLYKILLVTLIYTFPHELFKRE